MQNMIRDYKPNKFCTKLKACVQCVLLQLFVMEANFNSILTCECMQQLGLLAIYSRDSIISSINVGPYFVN